MRAARLAVTRNAIVASSGPSPITYVGKNGAANANGTSTSIPVPAGTQAGDVVFLSAVAWQQSVIVSAFSVGTWTLAANLGSSWGWYYWARLSAPLSGALTLTHSELDSQPTLFMLWAFRGVVASGQPYRSFVPGDAEATRVQSSSALTVTDAQGTDLTTHFGAAIGRNTVNNVDVDRVLSVNGTGRTVDQMAGQTATNPQGPASGIAYKTADTASLVWTTSGNTARWITGACALIPAP